MATALRAGLALNLGLACALLFAWGKQAREGQSWQADFTAFYAAWNIVLDGRGASLYDLDLQAEYQQRLIPERGQHGGLLPFNHPPHAVVPLAAFGLLPWPAAFYVWSAVQAGVLVVFLRQLLSLADARGDARWQVVAAALGFPGLFVLFQMGQVSLLVSVALAGFALALLRRQDVPLAAWLVLGTIKPQLVLVPAVLVLAGRRWRATAYAAALFAAWAGVATLLLGPASWLEFAAATRRSAGQTGGLGIFPHIMFNLKGLVYNLLGSDHSAAVNAVSVVGLLVALGAAAALAPRCGDRLTLALCLQLGLLTNPHLNPADTVAYAVPAALAWSALTGTRRVVVAGGLIACPLIMLVDLYGWPAGREGAVRPFLIAMLALAAILISGRGRWTSQ